MTNLSRKTASTVSSSLSRVVLVASAALLLVVAIFILVSAVASPISRGSGTASAPPTNTVASTATSTHSLTPAFGVPTPSIPLQLWLGAALVFLVVLLLFATRDRDEE